MILHIRHGAQVLPKMIRVRLLFPAVYPDSDMREKEEVVLDLQRVFCTFSFMEDVHKTTSNDPLVARARARRVRITGHISHSFGEAEDWDLDFWQSQGHEARLSALMDLRREVDIVNKARENAHESG
jgi:hypothetical protein